MTSSGGLFQLLLLLFFVSKTPALLRRMMDTDWGHGFSNFSAAVDFFRTKLKLGRSSSFQPFFICEESGTRKMCPRAGDLGISRILYWMYVYIIFMYILYYICIIMYIHIIYIILIYVFIESIHASELSSRRMETRRPHKK